jgi:putative salt-induced outer membrane protein YdiY
MTLRSIFFAGLALTFAASASAQQASAAPPAPPPPQEGTAELSFVGTTGNTSTQAFGTARMTTRLSLKVSNIARYVHQPVPGFNATDTITSFALVATF